MQKTHHKNVRYAKVFTQGADRAMSTIEDDVMNKKNEESAHSCSSQPKSRSQKTKTSAIEPPNGFIETINFDDTSKQMAELKAMIFNTPETNQTKIQFIKEELSAGRYQIRSHLIAEKLLEHTALVPQPAEIA